MKLRFTKMQGAGNDFVMLDGIGQRLDLDPARVRRIADRRFGIGADQVLVVERPSGDGADFRYRIFNADGGEVEQCGNGARCFVKFVHRLGLSQARTLRVQTLGGLIEPQLEDSGEVSVDMGAPDFRPAAVDLRTEGLVARMRGAARFWSLAPGGMETSVCVVSMGNPHAVQTVGDVDAAPVATLGPLLEREERFAKGVNAGFLQILDRSSIRLRVWERGAGETLSCGTGACAAAVTGIRMGVLDSPVRVLTRGGALQIDWKADGQAPQEVPAARVRMTGPAETVFEGEIELP